MEHRELGIIYNAKRAKQLIRYDGVRYADVAPTDIDGIIEYKDKIWVIWEVKSRCKDVPVGQKLLFERFIRMAKQSKKHAIAIIVEHDVDDVSEDIYLEKCKVRKYITTENTRWRKPGRLASAKEVAFRYISYYAKEEGMNDERNEKAG